VLSARTHHSKADRSIFEGFDVKGKVERTIVGGRVAFENGKLMAEKGSGRFIAASPRTSPPDGGEGVSALPEWPARRRSSST
jgi:dihydropyrimidinase